MVAQRKKHEELNCLSIWKYFASKFYLKYNSFYPNDRFSIELVYLKRALTKYSPYLLLEAIDVSIEKMPSQKCSILYLLSSKFFTRKFHDLIILNDIVKYKRFLPFYGNDQNTVDDLIQEYTCYACAYSLSAAELSRKKEILKLLEVLDAERIRISCIESDEGSEMFE
jgi:hypothetical protein